MASTGLRLTVDPGVREGLDLLLRALEVASGETLLTSVLAVSADGTRLHCLAGPGLAPEYCAAIDGGPVAPNAGSCGTAAYLGHEVFVTDIARDPNWTRYREVALTHGLRSCWSTPIKDAGDRVVATFAVYHREPRSPTPREIEAIRLASSGLLSILAPAPRQIAPGRAAAAAGGD